MPKTEDSHGRRAALARKMICPDCGTALWRVPKRLMPPYRDNKSIYGQSSTDWKCFACPAPTCEFTCAWSGDFESLHIAEDTPDLAWSPTE